MTVVRKGEPHVPFDPPPEADVLVSDDERCAIAVMAADCVPLLMADRKTGAVAAVHAGWRGTAVGAARAAVDTLQRHFGTTPADLVVAVGPSIGACCYDVGGELVEAFARAGHERRLIDRWFSARPRSRGAHHTVLCATDTPTLRLDLPAANFDQLVLAGVPADQIHLCGLCTASNLNVLYSYRGEGTTTGRLAAAIRKA